MLKSTQSNCTDVAANTALIMSNSNADNRAHSPQSIPSCTKLFDNSSFGPGFHMQLSRHPMRPSRQFCGQADTGFPWKSEFVPNSFPFVFFGPPNTPLEQQLE